MVDTLLNAVYNAAFMVVDGLGIQTPAGAAPAVAGDGTVAAAPLPAGGATPPGAEPSFFESMWPMLLIWGAVFVGMYFLMFRPQRKREKAMRELQSSIKTGDNIVTSGGVFGKVADVGTDCFVIEMGISGRTVKVPILKNDVLAVREPVLTPPPKEADVK